jgi:hypothetical protein
MTVYALITGSIFRAPEQRTAQSGKRYGVCTIKVSAAESDGSEFWSCICFSDGAQTELLRLAVGDKVSAQGKPKHEIYLKDGGNAKISHTLFADHLLPLRALPRERSPKTVSADAAPYIPPTQAKPSSDFDDDIPF